MKNRLFVGIASIATALLCLSCNGPIEVNGIVDSIKEIKDGNTIELNSGLIVHLCGVDPNNSFCKELLMRHLNEEVELTAESGDDQEIPDYDTEINAYVRLTGPAIDLNREILKTVGHKALYTSNCTDSLESFKRIWSGNDDFDENKLPDLSYEQMSAKLRAASMLVYGANENGGWVGTAFFISEDGLALSCDHVLNQRTANVVCISNSQGVINKEQRYKINSIVHNDADLDYAIFYVNLDDNARKNLNYLKLSTVSPVVGNVLGVVGNPLGDDLIMTFSDGIVKNIHENKGKVMISAQITHGFSGGPVCNSKGRIIGIAQSGIETPDGGTIANLNFAVDIRRVRQWLDENNIPYGGR